MEPLPSYTGKQLIRLLIADGWEPVRNNPHGVWLKKTFADRTRFTTVRDTRSVIPTGTLRAILGPRQTALGRDGLLRLFREYGRGAGR
jgi:predicted RNA binding protein YcfA (HicA-like mRNA interferase family)